MLQGADYGVAAGVCVAAQPKGSCEAEDIDSGIVADARGRRDKFVDADDGVVELPGLPPPKGQTALLQQPFQKFHHNAQPIKVTFGQPREVGSQGRAHSSSWG